MVPQSLHIKKLSGDGGGRDVKCQYSVSGHYLRKKNDPVYFKLGVYTLVSVFRNYYYHGPLVGQKWLEIVISGHYLEKLFDFGPQWMTRAGPIVTTCGPVMIENGSNG